jgi:Fic family protein
MEIGKKRKQNEGYAAFIPNADMSKRNFDFPQDIITKAAKAERLVGKLDGIAHSLPDADFFISMYIVKDATYSSQIEGTRATMMDALEMNAGINSNDTDAHDILQYIKAMNYGIKRLKEFPFSLRYVRELHSQLMDGARSSHFADPGNFRRSQNWINGTNPMNATYVPPPVHEMDISLQDFEVFIHQEKLVPIIHAALLHAQFETIHPFLDGNGRTGRLIITLFLYYRDILEKPVLFLSSFFKKHQNLYYERLNGYHEGRVAEWVNFFLDAVIDTAISSIEVSKNIAVLRERDMRKIQALGKREATSGVNFLQQLFRTPVITASITSELLSFSRPGALKLLERFVDLGILYSNESPGAYGRIYLYSDYIDIFSDK